MTKPSARIILYILIFHIFSCEQNHKIIPIEDYKGIIVSLVNTNNQLLKINDRLILNINGINIKFKYLLYDPQSVESTKIIIPVIDKLRSLTNNTDDILLDHMNTLLKKEGNPENWFTRDARGFTLFKKSFYGIENIDKTKYTTNLFGTESSESSSRAEGIRLELLKYRDKIIMLVGDSILNDKNQLLRIPLEKLASYESLEAYLDAIAHINKRDILNIYKDLTIRQSTKFTDAEIPWNQIAFNNQPLIGAISTFNSYRNRLRFAQEAASKMLLSRIERPLRPLYEYQEKTLDEN